MTGSPSPSAVSPDLAVGSRWYVWRFHWEVVDHVEREGEALVRLRKLGGTGRDTILAPARAVAKYALPSGSADEVRRGPNTVNGGPGETPAPAPSTEGDPSEEASSPGVFAGPVDTDGASPDRPHPVAGTEKEGIMPGKTRTRTAPGPKEAQTRAAREAQAAKPAEETPAVDETPTPAAEAEVVAPVSDVTGQTPDPMAAGKELETILIAAVREAVGELDLTEKPAYTRINAKGRKGTIGYVNRSKKGIRVDVPDPNGKNGYASYRLSTKAEVAKAVAAIKASAERRPEVVVEAGS